MKCQNKFWLYNPIDLLCSTTLIPLNNMDLEEKMNSITRFVILIFLLLFLTNCKKSYVFLIISILFIIIIYYIQKRNIMNNQTKENYSPDDPGFLSKTSKYFPFMFMGRMDKEVRDRYPDLRNEMANITYKKHSCNNSNRFCNDNVPTGYDETYISSNQSLAGFPNERMNIKPIIIEPSHDLDHWRANNLVIHSHINDESVMDEYLSGYSVSNCCGYECNAERKPVDGDKLIFKPQFDKVYCKKGKYDDNRGYDETIKEFEYIEKNADEEQILEESYINKEDYLPRNKLPEIENRYDMNFGYNNHGVTFEPEIIEKFTPQKKYNNFNQKPNEFSNQNNQCYNKKEVSEYSQEYNYPYTETMNSNKGIIGEPTNGDVNASCGYNPNNIYKSNLPSNYISGNCQRNEVFKDYNKNLFTQTIQPGVFSHSEILEPINSNIGISFQQQFEPVTCKSDDKSVEFTLHDPRIIEPVKIEKTPCDNEIKATYDNIVDPRQYGYGTSYRSYIDDLTGQPKFYYDDINSVRNPNYIVRSKIDHLKFADSYGPIPAEEVKGNSKTASIRALANDEFLRNSLKQRNDLTERWMRKMNTVLAQRREFPLSRAAH